MALREIRKARKDSAPKFSLAEMGKVLGVGAAQARNYEMNPSRLSYQQAVALSKWLGCSTKDLF